MEGRGARGGKRWISGMFDFLEDSSENSRWVRKLVKRSLDCCVCGILCIHANAVFFEMIAPHILPRGPYFMQLCPLFSL